MSGILNALWCFLTHPKRIVWYPSAIHTSCTVCPYQHRLVEGDDDD